MENKKIILGLALSGMIVAGGCNTSNNSGATKLTGECHGINSCKGTGDCGGKGHSCAGKNSCKGQGWLKMSQEECEGKGGTFKS